MNSNDMLTHCCKDKCKEHMYYYFNNIMQQTVKIATSDSNTMLLTDMENMCISTGQQNK